MKKTIVVYLMVTYFMFPLFSYGQTRHEATPTICPANDIPSSLRVPLPQKFLNSQKRGQSDFSANFQVTYTGFEEFPEAQEAFQFAVDIWASLLKSDVPIYLSATFMELEAGVLGSAGPTSTWSGFEGALNDTTIYHVALAEKLARKEINIPGEADITARFGSTFNWYFGTDGNTPSGQYDFITIVLHEIGHGLGFSSLDTHEGSTASVRPGSYNNFMVNGSDVSIYEIANNSAALATYLTSTDLFLNAPSAVTANGGANAEIYAPSTYNGGSSISHLGESFNGTAHALMTYSASPGASIHNPEGVTLGLFADMGWESATLVHNQDWVHSNLSEDIELSLEVRSDLSLVDGSSVPTLHYSFDDFSTSTDVSMTDIGSGVFTYSIPNPEVMSELSYYFSGIEDNLGRKYTAPSHLKNADEIVNTYSMAINDGAQVSLPFLIADGGNLETGAVFQSIAMTGRKNIWEHGTPSNTLNNPTSGTQAWKTDLDSDITKPEVDYSSGLLSPQFDLSDENGDYNLSFNIFMDNASGALGLSVLSSIDGGLSWQTLGAIDDKKGENWYNISVSNLPSIVRAWIFDEAEVRHVSYSLSELVGESEVYFMIVAAVTNQYDAINYESDGILLDDFELTKTDPLAKFISSEPEGLFWPGSSVDFEYISSGATSFAWDFGDGGTSDLEAPSHTYEESGTYSTTLTISHSTGTDSQSKDLIIAGAVGTSFSLADGGNFENNNGSIVAQHVSGTPWQRGQSSIAKKNGTSSGDFAWVTGLNEAEYLDQSEGFLYTPLFDFSLIGDYVFSFYAKYDTEEDWDGFIVEYSLDGDSWQQLAPEVSENWYDGTAEDNTEQGWPAIPLFSGDTDGRFIQKSIDISDLTRNSLVGFRFHWKSDFASVDVGIAIDDFQLIGPATGAASASFSIDGTTGCDGQEVTFTNESTGSITSMSWDFGTFANPLSAEGVGPHLVTYSNGSGPSTVVLTIESPVNGTVIKTETDVITTAPNHSPTIMEEEDADFSTYKIVASQGDTYQWYNGDEILKNENAKELIVADKGDYSAEVTIDGCAAITDELSDFILSIENNDAERQELIIHPNPSKGIINFNPSQVSLLNLYSVSGERIISFNPKGTDHLDISNMKNGIYLIEMISKGKVSKQRFILAK